MKTILVTGSTDGIGLEAAKQLALGGHEVVIHGRNQERAEHARGAVLHVAPDAALDTVHADFAGLSAVACMAQDLVVRLPKLDVLINNAGVYMARRRLSDDGFEMTFAVNYLAHFVLTMLLLPLLKKSGEPRVISVSSVAHESGRIEFDNLNGERNFSGYGAYANSKLADALFAAELARREPWLTSNSLHPGVIDTKLLHAGFNMKGAPVAVGARTHVYLATSPDVKGVSGKYFYNCKPSQPSPQAKDPQLARQLWEWAEAAVRRWLPA